MANAKIEFDYSDEAKAIDHDHTRYAWENESGYWLIWHQEEHGPEIARYMSDAFEYGFNAGWEKAKESN